MRSLLIAIFFLPVAFANDPEPACVAKLRATLAAENENSKGYSDCKKTMNGKDEIRAGEGLHIYPLDYEKVRYEALTVNLGGTDFGGPLPLVSSDSAQVSCAPDGSVISEALGLYRYKLKLEEKALVISYKNFSTDPDYQLEFSANCRD